MSGDVVIRRATWEDAEALWPLRYALHVSDAGFSHKAPVDDNYGMALMRHRFRELMLDPEIITFMAAVSGRPEAYAMFTPGSLCGYDGGVKTMTLTALYVAPRLRMGSVGFRLLRAATDAVKDVGLIHGAVAAGNLQVHENVMARGAVPVAVIYEWEPRHGNGLRRGRDKRAEAVKETEQAGDCDAPRGDRRLHESSCVRRDAVGCL